MHEMSLAGGILKVVDDAASREPFARVQRLTLAAGALAGVEVRALRFALEAMAPGTRLEGAEIVIHEPPGQAWCMG
jgi:hydrogenase nickel incorporation protein HypA/HybF